MIRAATACDTGPRENLEDTALAARFSLPNGDDLAALVVCDGVGGHSAGEVASALALTHIHGALASAIANVVFQLPTTDLDPSNWVKELRNILVAANRLIVEQAGQHPACADMATTVVCALAVDGHLVVGWAGDSRCYRHRDGSLVRLTRDHSKVEELIDQGVMRRCEAKDHPLAHTITRYLGQGSGFEPELTVTDLQAGDLIVLCTDGLTDVLSDQDIQLRCAALNGDDSALESFPGHLVKAAVRAGTQDNTTVLCCAYGHNERIVRTDATTTDGYALSVARVLNLLSPETNDGPKTTIHSNTAA